MRRPVIALLGIALVLGLTGCGESSKLYPASKVDGVFFSVPKNWNGLSTEELNKYESKASADQQKVNQSLVRWQVAYSVDPKIKALIFIPEAHLATSKARKLLPETIPHQDAVLNASRAALLVHAIQSRPDLLLEATEDLLHQNYRAEAMPKSMALVTKLRAAGVPAMISGAGPSVLVLHTLDDLEVEAVIKVGAGSFAAQKLGISTHGVE